MGVVFSFLSPSGNWITRMPALRASRWVANGWRSAGVAQRGGGHALADASGRSAIVHGPVRLRRAQRLDHIPARDQPSA
jgi:hypothetical protein